VTGHPNVADFPPSFDGNPWTYGAALFSLTLVCSLALAMLSRYLFEIRAARAAAGINYLDPPPSIPFASPFGIYRTAKACLLLTILIGALPDVLVMFAWGEASQSTMETLFLVDRIGDALTVVPFVTAALLSEWGRQVIPHQLAQIGFARVAKPRWRTVKNAIKIASITLVIATGVTLAKAKIGI
jgi:hypothetical protein